MRFGQKLSKFLSRLYRAMFLRQARQITLDVLPDDARAFDPHGVSLLQDDRRSDSIDGGEGENRNLLMRY
jgi:hypothetical protein